MPIILIVGDQTFEFPVEGDLPGYGQNITDWAQAVTDALQTVQQPGDILPSTATINNNVSSPTAINGFSFSSSQVLSFESTFYVQRTTDTPANNLVQSGTIMGNYDGANWTVSVGPFLGNSGVTFNIDNTGQLTYTSTNITGSDYEGFIRFQAKVITPAV